MFTKFNLREYNFKLLLLVLIETVLGIIIINSADSSFTSRQIFGACLGFAVMIFLSIVEYDFICKFYMIYYILNAVLLLLVLLVGENVNHATRWIRVGGANGVQFQPSEFAKLFMIIFIATFLQKYKDLNKINSVRCIFSFLLYIGVCLLLIVQEPDLSTTICLTLILVTMLYVSGLSYKIIGLCLLIFVPIGGSFLWYIQQPNQILLKQYQVNRILQFIYPNQYGGDYTQQNNSIMAIGSGQLTGKGLNTSTMATVKDANFISEQQTDFIFSVVGEELGFVGSVIIIAILLLIVLQCIHVGRHAKDMKGTLLCTGVACLIAYQAFINISVATGILPNTGIPLPFVSYGLSSLLSLSAGIGLVLNVSLHQTTF